MPPRGSKTHSTLLPYQSSTYGTGFASDGRIPNCGGGVAPARGSVTGHVPGARKDGVAVGCGDDVDGGVADEHLATETALRHARITTRGDPRAYDTGQDYSSSATISSIFQPRSTRAPCRSLVSRAGCGSIERLKLTLQSALRVLALPVGVGVGLCTTLLTSQACHIFRSARGNGTACTYPTAIPHADFALWTCALFGAAAAAVVLLISIAVRRPARH